MKLKVLRKVAGMSQGAVDLINKQDGFYGDEVNLFVDNDYPRDSAVAYELQDTTVGFAVAGPDGEILREFPTLAQAEKAAAGARVVFSVDVDGLDDEAPVGRAIPMSFADPVEA